MVFRCRPGSYPGHMQGSPRYVTTLTAGTAAVVMGLCALASRGWWDLVPARPVPGNYKLLGVVYSDRVTGVAEKSVMTREDIIELTSRGEGLPSHFEPVTCLEDGTTLEFPGGDLVPAPIRARLGAIRSGWRLMVTFGEARWPPIELDQSVHLVAHPKLPRGALDLVATTGDRRMLFRYRLVAED